MNDDQVDAIARTIVEQTLSKQPFEPLTGDERSDDLADAYRIQDKVYERLGKQAGWGPMGGHKIALTSPAIQELVGLKEPIYGGVFASQVYSSPHTLNLADYQRIGLEFEITVRLASDVPAQQTPWTASSISGHIDSVMPAFELIEDRAANYEHLDAFSLVADRCWCAGAVVGEPTQDLAGLDLAALPSRARVNGEVSGSAHTGLALGSPLNGLAWVANSLLQRGRMLRAGDIVITGSALQTYFVQAGDVVCYEVDGLGSVTVEVRA